MRVIRAMRATTLLLAIGCLLTDAVGAQRARRARRPARTATPREGFWMSGGIGVGSFGCSNCDRQTGLSGGLAAGGTLSPRLLLGAGTAGWTKSEGATTLSAATLDARVRFYPKGARGRFFLTGGLGLGTLRSSVRNTSLPAKNGTSALVGAGMDLRFSRNASVTPYVNAFGIRAGGTSVHVIQIGAALTLH